MDPHSGRDQIRSQPGRPEAMSEETFGQYLKARRNALGLSLRDVERITEGAISNAALSQVETGKIRRPTIAMVALLTAAYSLDVAEVFDRARNGGKLPPPLLICEACGQFIRGSRP